MKDLLTLFELVEDAYNNHEEKLAIQYDNGEQKTAISYRQLWDISSQVKMMLSGRENEVVGLCLKIDHRMPAMLLGILRCNSAFYNFDVKGFGYAAKVLEEVGAQVIIIHQTFSQEMQDHIEAIGGISTPLSIPELRDYMLVTLQSVMRKKHSVSLAYCITTSGTTGKPKVVMVPHQCIVPNIIHLSDLFSLTSDDLVLAATALTFDPSIVEIFMTLSVGACLLIVPPAVKMMPHLLLDMVHERNKVTVMQITPTLLSRFNAGRLSQSILGDNSVMRVIALGGEKFPACIWLHSLMSPCNRTQFYNLYGTTEVSCWAACYKVTCSDLRTGAEIPLGEPLLDTVVEVHNESGQRVMEGEGRLWIGGWRRQCKLSVADVLQYDRLVLRDTGDIVRVGDNGKLYYLGRKDQQRKRNGRRINLEEIKMVGRRHSDVCACEVMLIRDQLVAFIVLSQETKVASTKATQSKVIDVKVTDVKVSDVKVTSDHAKVKVTEVEVIEKYMKEHLPSHWWPDCLIAICKLPVTNHGKIDYKSLERLYEEKQVIPCKTNIADYLDDKWKELTGHCRDRCILETENFILAGGDSVKAVQLANVIENYLSIQLPYLVDMILHKTYAEVRQYLTDSLQDRIKWSNASVNDADDKRVISDITGDRSGSLCEIEHKADTIAGKNSSVFESKDDSKITVPKRKFSEDDIVNDHKIVKKKANFKHDFQYSVSRCNRILKTKLIWEKKEQPLEKGFEKEFDMSVCSEGSYKSDVSGNINECKLDKRKEYQQIVNTSSEVTNHFKTEETFCLNMEEVWKYDTGKCVDASPLLAVNASGDFLVLIGSHSHRVGAIVGSTGQKLWEITLPDRIESSACLSSCGNFVIIGCYDGNVYTLHVDTGDIWWQLQTGSQVKCSPVVDTQTGLIYTGSHSQTVYCLDVSLCEVVWQKNLASGSIFSSPTVSSDPHQLYVASLGGKVFAINPENGKTLWEYNFSKPVFSSPAVTVLGIVVGCTDNYLYHLSSKGHLLWKFSTGGHIFSSPSVLRQMVTTLHCDHLSSRSSVIVESCNIIQIDCERKGSDGECQDINSNRGSYMQTFSEYITVGSHDRCLFCISSTGDLVWKLQVDSEVYSSPFQCYLRNNSVGIKCDVEEHDSDSQFENSNVGFTKDVKCSSKSVFSFASVSEKRCQSHNKKCDILCENSCCQVTYTSCNKLEIEDHDKDRTYKALHVVVFASTVGTLYIVHVPTGKILCTKHLDGEIFSSPIVYKNTVVVGCRNDFVYCFKIL